MATLQAIPSTWNGTVYRSRLEAKWAYFFSQIGLHFTYEPEGYELGGERYLPDFTLTKLRMYAEVKPLDFDEREQRVAEKLAKASGCPVLKLVGEPDFKPYPAIHYVQSDESDWFEEHEYLLDVIRKRTAYENGRLWVVLPHESIYPSHEDLFSDEYGQAVHAARVARFSAGGKW